MKLATSCPVCNARQFEKRLGFISPFIAHRVFDYEIAAINYGGGTFVPTHFTNALKCKECDFLFSQARYDDNEMARIYQDYRSEEYTRVRDIFEPGYAADVAANIGTHPQETRNRMAALRQFLQGYTDTPPITSILDYGGDRGQNIPDFPSVKAKYVYEVSGAETIPGVTRVTNLARQAPVDLVMNANVLEHIPYPGTVVEEMKTLCHRNSLLFIDVPDDLTGRNPYPNQFHEHINFFTPRSLRTLLRTHGFEVLKVENIECDLGWTNAQSIYALARPAWFD